MGVCLRALVVDSQAVDPRDKLLPPDGCHIIYPYAFFYLRALFSSCNSFFLLLEKKLILHESERKHAVFFYFYSSIVSTIYLFIASSV